MGVFFTSDLHVSHRRIIEFHRTQFSSVEEMNAVILDSINSTCGKEDDLYILGDCHFGKAVEIIEYFSKIACRKHLILGNHDQHIRDNRNFCQEVFDSVQSHLIFKADKCRVELFHKPIHEWDQMDRGGFHFHGHCHGGLGDEPWHRRFDVGIDNDMAKFKPFKWEYLRDLMLSRPVTNRPSKDQKC